MKKFVALLTKGKPPRMNGKRTATFFQLYTLYMKNQDDSFYHIILVNLFKQRYISSVTSYKYLNKLISEV